MFVQVVLKCEGRRACAVGRKGRAAPVELFVRRGHNHDRHASARDEGQGVIGWFKVVKTESLLQECLDEARRRIGGGVCDLGEGVKMRLANTKGGRDFLADRQALADAVVCFDLF